MHLRLFKIITFALIAFAANATNAQKVKQPKITDTTWEKPYVPFRIAGNLYYVGSYDLGSYLIVTSQGNVLINTGVASSGKQIEKNIKKLGFKPADTKILLTTQAHYDHMGAMAFIKNKTHAKMMVDEGDAQVLKDGGRSDYAFGRKDCLFEPVKPDVLLHNGDTVSLGGMQITMLHHPGHTKGSCSFLFTVKDERRSWKVLIANMPSIVIDKPFKDVTNYPNIASDYGYTLKAMKNIKFDIWLASHASQFKLQSKHKPGDAYNPSAFVDQAGYDQAINGYQQTYDEKLKEDK
jgi:metallo-beta-lactamase class B